MVVLKMPGYLRRIGQPVGLMGGVALVFVARGAAGMARPWDATEGGWLAFQTPTNRTRNGASVAPMECACPVGFKHYPLAGPAGEGGPGPLH